MHYPAVKIIFKQIWIPETQLNTKMDNPVPVPAPEADKPTDQDTVNMDTTETNPDPPKPPKKKRIRKKKDSTLPRMALSGYNFFMRDIRQSVMERNPDANIQDITRKVALEWGSLNEEQKKPFKERAEVEKIRYNREMDEYRKMKKAQADARDEEENKVEAEIKKDNKPEVIEPTNNSSTPLVNGKPNGGTAVVTQERGQSYNELLKKRTGDYDIPIFTDDFLEHNKALDSELRTLRKSQTDYEQQNAILEKHVENMETGVEKLTGETEALKETNRVLSNYLEKLRQKLVESLSGLSIPSQLQGATLANIDQYMVDLQNMVTSNSHGPASLNKARDIIRKSDLQVQFQ